jgi:hypothetical protein
VPSTSKQSSGAREVVTGACGDEHGTGVEFGSQLERIPPDRGIGISPRYYYFNKSKEESYKLK